MAFSTLQLASRRLLQVNARPSLASRQSSGGSSGPGFKPRPFFATINGRVLYLVLPVLLIGLFTVLPCYTLDEIGPADRFNWETKDKKK
jgi:hypothetical protein